MAAADAKLASQAEAAALVDAAHAEELAHLRRAEREAYEWDRFASCCSRLDPRDPRAMLAYETAARASTDSGLSLGGALDLACEHERIIAEAEVYREWALAEGAVEEAEALAACRGRMRALTGRRRTAPSRVSRCAPTRSRTPRAPSWFATRAKGSSARCG